MDSQTRLSRVQTPRYPTFMYFALVAVAAETLFIHYKATSQSQTLKLRLDDLDNQQDETSRKLLDVQKLGSNVKKSFMQMMRNYERKLNFRVRRDINEKYQPPVGYLKALRLQLLRLKQEERRLTILMNQDVMKHEVCRNATLICKKGERGPRGKSGPRGYKGDTGSKGERGFSGPKGDIGISGAIGPKGQKGDPGQAGKSLQKPRIFTPLQTQITKAELGNLSLLCEANGNPPPNIRWQFGKKIVDSRYTFPVKGGLMISDIRKSDEGRIQCVAESIMGKDVRETELIVHTKPKVILSSNRLTAIEGMAFDIVCKASGTPLPELKWKRGFGDISARQVLSSDKKNLSLHFNKINIYDAGTYICEAHNIIGKDVRPFYITVNAMDCSGYKESVKSSIYTINPDGRQPFTVFCDMDTSNGGWTVIQRRTDGSVDFFKNWVDYKLGFGSLENEFWLGNEKIYRLTKRKNMMIRIDLEDFDGSKVYAEYRTFYIDGENDNYRLHVSSYSGTAGDSLSYHNGMQFSTKDRDNDAHGSNCAVIYYGAWWFHSCHYSNLNGKYRHTPHNNFPSAINWYHFKNKHSVLKRSEMKVRPAM